MEHLEQIWHFISHPFVLGFALGLLILCFVWKAGFTARRTLKLEIARIKKELDDLQGHLNTQLKINAGGNEKLQSELEKLRIQNENLRMNIVQIQQKPGRGELRRLHIIETAASRMRERAPGFAPAWEQALREAEDEYKESEGGFKRLVRRVIPAIGMNSSTASANSEADMEV
jgi:uncharacterized membrane-anchored protein YhcB (DUF1043 family)